MTRQCLSFKVDKMFFLHVEKTLYSVSRKDDDDNDDDDDDDDCAFTSGVKVHVKVLNSVEGLCLV